MDAIICQAGGPEANLTGMTTGAVKGNIDDQTANVLSGARVAANAI